MLSTDWVGFTVHVDRFGSSALNNAPIVPEKPHPTGWTAPGAGREKKLRLESFPDAICLGPRSAAPDLPGTPTAGRELLSHWQSMAAAGRWGRWITHTHGTHGTLRSYSRGCEWNGTPSRANTGSDPPHTVVPNGGGGAVALTLHQR